MDQRKTNSEDLVLLGCQHKSRPSQRLLNKRFNGYLRHKRGVRGKISHFCRIRLKVNLSDYIFYCGLESYKSEGIL